MEIVARLIPRSVTNSGNGRDGRPDDGNSDRGGNNGRGFHRIVGTIILIGGALLVAYLAPRFFNLSESAPADPI